MPGYDASRPGSLRPFVTLLSGAERTRVLPLAPQGPQLEYYR